MCGSNFYETVFKNSQSIQNDSIIKGRCLFYLTPKLWLKNFKLTSKKLIGDRIMILADSLPEYASSNFAISSKSTESSSDTFLRFKSSRFLRAIRLGRPMRILFSKRRRNASSISRNMWFKFCSRSSQVSFHQRNWCKKPSNY